MVMPRVHDDGRRGNELVERVVRVSSDDPFRERVEGVATSL